MEIYRASDGSALAFDDRGPRGGTPLLFLHGWRADHTVWEPVVERLEARHRTIGVDLRGSGESRGAPGPYTVEAFSSDLADLVTALDLDPVVALGHSMGAALAQRFAVDHPDALEGLVLISPIPASGSPFKPAVEEFLRSTVGDPQKTAVWLSRLTRTELEPDLAELLRAAAARASGGAALESLDSWLRLDFAGEAATIETPTLVVVPDGDPPMTPARVRELVADLIAGSHLDVVGESGHYLPLERPAELIRLVEAFLAELVAV
jgi:pimeloyl-ACP methyl ester carboxylesterase